MISVYKLKPKFQQLLHPLLVWLHRRGVTANEITVVAIVFSFGIGALLGGFGGTTFLFGTAHRAVGAYDPQCS